MSLAQAPGTGAGRVGAAALAIPMLLLGCGTDDATAPAGAQRADSEPAVEREPNAGSRLEPAGCPPGLANCTAAGGTVLAVERIDPDGDGDAHFVLLSEQGITAPGISVIDVAAELRPSPLPGPGDEISAAGPVQTGSYGQRQIEATKIRVRRVD